MLVLCEHLRSHPRFASELTTENIQLIFDSAPLLDIGNVSIPDNILHKPGRLTPDEWVVMQRHAEIGVAAIAAVHGRCL